MSLLCFYLASRSSCSMRSRCNKKVLGKLSWNIDDVIRTCDTIGNDQTISTIVHPKERRGIVINGSLTRARIVNLDSAQPFDGTPRVKSEINPGNNIYLITYVCGSEIHILDQSVTLIQWSWTKRQSSF